MENKLLFDTVHKTLHDKRGGLVKRLECPKLLSWNHPAIALNQRLGSRHCELCERTVFDTAYMTAEEIIATVTDDPNACLRVCLKQSNIEIKVRNE